MLSWNTTVRHLLLLAALLAAAPDPEPFTDVAAETGLDFVHFNGMSGELYFPEIMGAGAAWLDYDADGDLDAYLVQGERLGPGKPPQDAHRGRLFRNDLVRLPDGRTAPRFVDVTAGSGLDARGYGMGAATGDYDGDGHVDLYLTFYGSNRLYRNNGDGTFSDVTARSGTGISSWSTAASFFDYDRDGRLDLFVTRYVEYSVEKNPACYAPSTRRDYCGPGDFPPLADVLFHNRGDGTFEDVSARSGIGRVPGPGLGAVAFDADADGWPDLYVANDGAPNRLWVNQKDGTFRDDALLAGAAVNRRGLAEAGMGVDAGDFDADGDEDIFLTHLTGETNTLYLNLGGGLFEDRTLETGAGQGSLPFTSFGTAWFDWDNDGWLEYFIANGAVRILEAQARAGNPFPVEQTNQLYRNAAGKLEEVTERAGAVFRVPGVGRGAAFGDVDNDGDTDVLLANNNGPARLLLNQVGNRRPWLGLQGGGIGTRVEILRRGAPALVRRVRTDGSYLSANDPRVLAGLGEGEAAAVRVRWPDGKVVELGQPAGGRYLWLGSR